MNSLTFGEKENQSVMIVPVEQAAEKEINDEVKTKNIVWVLCDGTCHNR